MFNSFKISTALACISILAGTISTGGLSSNISPRSISKDKYIYELKELIKETSNTFSCSIKLSEDLSNDVVGGIIMGNYYNTPNGYPGCVDFAVSKGGYFDIYWNNGEFKYTFTSADLRTGNWIDLAVVRDDKNSKIYYYVDGILKETVDAKISEAVCLSKYRIGMNINNWYLDRWNNIESPFMGEIKQISLFSSPLDQKQIESLHNKEIEINSTNFPNLQTNLEFNPSTFGYDEIILDTSNNHNDGKLITYNRYVDVKETGEYDYAFAVIPDMQAMTYHRPDLLNQQADWLAKNAEQYKIKFAMYLGDMVESKFINDPENSDLEWYIFTNAIKKLDGILPYTFILGNHDYDSWAQKDRSTTQFNKYMPYSKYSKVPHFLGAYKEGYMDNIYYGFNIDGIEYLVFCLEEAPENRVLNWADRIISMNPKKRVFITTHSFITPQGLQVSTSTSKYSPENTINYAESNNADKMWKNHFSKHANIVAIFSGHECCDDIVYRTDKGINSNTVYQFLIDAQGSIGTCAMNTFLLIKVNEKNKTWDLCYYSPETNSCFGKQNQFQLSFKDKFNPSVGE